MGKNYRQRRSKKSKFTFKVSEHFSKKDFYCASGAPGLKLSMGLIGGLELLRSIVQKRITIVKGYESTEVSERSSSYIRNYYVKGVAALITAEDMPLDQLFQAAEQVPEFMGIGLDLTHQAVHVDTRKTDERSLWVENKGEVIDLTDANRAKYLTHAPENTDS